jgi:hypothetical protein
MASHDSLSTNYSDASPSDLLAELVLALPLCGVIVRHDRGCGGDGATVLDGSGRRA